MVLTPHLERLAEECRLAFVNTEEWPWVKPVFDRMGYSLKPDGIFAPSPLFVVRQPHGTDALRSLRGQHPAHYYFGVGIWELRDCYVVWEFKLGAEPADRGKAYILCLPPLQ